LNARHAGKRRSSGAIALVLVIAWIVLFTVYDRASYSLLVAIAWFAVIALRPPPTKRQ
jgi:hypothetical protein